MTKSGKPSPIKDIRYFAGAGRYVEGCHEATAFGRRVALLLRTMGHSFGSWTHLYIQTVESDLERVPLNLSEAFAWWVRNVHVAVPKGFPSLPEPERVRILIAKTRNVLLSLGRDQTDIKNACDTALREGDQLRFLVKRKTIAGKVFELSFNVATFPAASNLLLTRTDPETGAVFAATAVPLAFYVDAPHLAGDIRQKDNTIAIIPKTSFTAQQIAAGYDAPLVFETSELTSLSKPLQLSGLIVGPV